MLLVFSEMDEFLIELEEDVEGMQSTIYFLQQQLKEAKEQNVRLQHEVETLRTAAAHPLPADTQQDQTRTSPDQSTGKYSAPSTGETRTAPSTSSPTRSSPSPTHSPPGSRQLVSKHNSLHSPPPPSLPAVTAPQTSAGGGGPAVKSEHTKSQSQTSNGGGPAPREADSSNNNTETDLSDEGPTEESGPDNSQTHHYPTRGREQKNGGPARVAAGKYTDPGPGDNTDATSSEGWSPSASKHSGSLGAADDDLSSSVSEADPSTDAKSGETIPNGIAASPQFDSQGEEEEDMET